MALKTMISITTFEIYNGGSHPTVTHVFIGDNEDEARGVMNAHRQADQFFNASFSGNYNGIVLVNSEPLVEVKQV